MAGAADDAPGAARTAPPSIATTASNSPSARATLATEIAKKSPSSMNARRLTRRSRPRSRSFISSADRPTLFRQPKLGNHRSGGRFFQRKEIERPGIAVVGCDRGGNQQTGHPAGGRHGAQGFGSVARPCQEKICVAGYRRKLRLALAWKQGRGGRDLVHTRRAICIHVGP